MSERVFNDRAKHKYLVIATTLFRTYTGTAVTSGMDVVHKSNEVKEVKAFIKEYFDDYGMFLIIDAETGEVADV